MIDLSKCKGVIVELDSEQFEKLDVFVPSVDIRVRRIDVHGWKGLLGLAERTRLAKNIAEFTD